MFSSWLYRAQIYSARIYTDEEYNAPVKVLDRCKKWCSPSEIIRTTIRPHRGMLSSLGEGIPSGSMSRSASRLSRGMMSKSMRGASSGRMTRVR